MVDVDALGGRFELAQRVDRRGRDEPMAGGRGDGTLGEADRFVLVAREGDTRTSERRPFASAVIATITGRGPAAAPPTARLPPSWTTEMMRRSSSSPNDASAIDCTSRTICFGCLPGCATTWTSDTRPSGSATSRAMVTSGSRQISRSTSVRSISSNAQVFRRRRRSGWIRAARARRAALGIMWGPTVQRNVAGRVHSVLERRTGGGLPTAARPSGSR